ncbi:MAG: hypothetical protein AAGG01_15180, partial [Planctomycetota bacterium]
FVIPLLVFGSVGIVSMDRPGKTLAKIHEGAESLARTREAYADLRPALHGETIPGRAWDRYRAAIKAMRTVPRFLRLAEESIEASTTREREARDQHLKSAAPALKWLAERARCEDATSRVLLRNGLAARTVKTVDVMCLSHLSVGQAKALLEQGDSLRAVRHLLDAQQLGRDLMDSPVAYEVCAGNALLVPESMDRFLVPDGLESLDPPAVELWLQGLDQLLADLPRGDRAIPGSVEMFAWETIATRGEEKQRDWAVHSWFRGRKRPSGFPWMSDHALYLSEQTNALASLTGSPPSTTAVPSLDGFDGMRDSRANALDRLATLRTALTSGRR